jgi:altronate hydrolase
MDARWIVADAADSVAVALSALDAGEAVGGITLIQAIPAGHKFALRPVERGESVIKLGHAIGIAAADIAAGAHVHEHNLAFAGGADRQAIGTEIRQPAAREAHFQGYVRADGRVGTRNFIGILTSVNCSATVAKRIAAQFHARATSSVS